MEAADLAGAICSFTNRIQSTFIIKMRAWTPPLPYHFLPPEHCSLPWKEISINSKKQNPHKADGPKSVSPSTLKHCTDQLSPVFTDIFSIPL